MINNSLTRSSARMMTMFGARSKWRENTGDINAKKYNTVIATSALYNTLLMGCQLRCLEKQSLLGLSVEFFLPIILNSNQRLF